MSTEQKDENLLPEERQVKDLLQDSTKRIEEINFWKANIPPLSGPMLVPPGTPNQGWTPEKRASRKKALEDRIDEIREETKNQAVKITEKSSLDMQLKLYQEVDDWAEPKVDREKDIKERKELNKDVSYSQDLTMVMLNKKNISVLPSSTVKEPQPETSDGRQTLSTRLSDRFSLSPNRTILKEEPNERQNRATRNKEIDLDKED